MDSTFGEVPESSVRVLIADEYANRRRTIRCALTASATVRVVGEAVDVDDLVVELERRQPRVLVVSDDLLQERADVAHIHVHLQALGSIARTLVLTESPSAESLRHPLREHLWGCLSYSRVEQDLVKAVVAIAQGEMWFSRRELAEMLRERPERAVVTDLERLILRGLTSREIEVVQWVMRGKTNKEVARALKISDLTVKTHVQNIFKKCGLRRRSELPSQMLAA
jgi:two-component system, NarL family, nitrate/nitrite response regulator NarL